MIVSLAVTRRDRVFILGANDAGQHAAVGRGDHVGQIVLADQGTRVENVGEQVIEVRTVRARQVRADLAADAEERVALLANLGENGPAQAQDPVPVPALS